MAQKRVGKMTCVEHHDENMTCYVVEETEISP